ncbi:MULTISPECIES: acyl-homoserine-lactone synthase TraI [unclassified Mesorhizobium]|uniref:acyl-homoserine-lactone synthase n=1 Tax=unclassified Mesorhizobium TaxID=325217 RepID=UPI000FDB177A|nr:MULTISPECIES: acyl-homoserine-lactone synthase TraI [unclassified Mesorhizobium]TGQ04872.1 GNAT family N-acetyltransferase [Mesorhizobium sp. M2E.F.Ca.ET.219.01.1.1]TGT65419.1 GNAT family N-acetyltransferase [Mesorhizobium sp. M2E.F.Ca.ET.166.01.1.1]TGV97465.1 GNAT family N-acetyltransferase [Mesorhizobium sp. M2E.F.Ca.ET.154.01.1.1]
MLARAIRNGSGKRDRELIDAYCRLRAVIFADRLEWNVHVRNNRETDEFDLLDPTYIVVTSDDGAIIGGARLLPALGDTMLERTFPQLLAVGRLNAHARLIESSRFCVDTTFSEGRGGPLHQATLTMFAAIIEWSMLNGYTEIATATDLRFERILNRAGWPMKRLGKPCRIGSTIAIAGILPADRASFIQVCPPGYRSAFQATRRQAA